MWIEKKFVRDKINSHNFVKETNKHWVQRKPWELVTSVNSNNGMVVRSASYMMERSAPLISSWWEVHKQGGRLVRSA